jgi:RNA polymerase sigma-32 factor
VLTRSNRGSSFDRGEGLYIRETRKFPLLERGEERLLAKRWRENRDAIAAHRLVTSHLRLVVRMAGGYRGYGLPLPDLISEGNVGLMQAVNGFDPDRGFRFSTYAMWWIRAAIQTYILRSWSLVKIGTTAAQKKLFFSLSKLKKRLNAAEQRDLSPETVKAIASSLRVSEVNVVDMNRRLAAADLSLNVPIHVDGEEDWQDRLPDNSDSHETQLGERQEVMLRRNAIRAAMSLLTERERDILIGRRLRNPSLTFAELAQKYNISRERVRQIEAVALKKVRSAVTPGSCSLVTSTPIPRNRACP